MRPRPHLLLVVLLGAVAVTPGLAQDQVPLPAGVRARWDLLSAWREATPTRERICLNSLWRWQPAREQAGPVPAAEWGWFKVPGPWPGMQDWLQKDCQTVYAHPKWRDLPLRDVTAAWYQREIDTPPTWRGRRISLRIDTLNSYAAAYLNGQPAGELRFPGGELDLTPVLQPGLKATLSLLVVAMPLKATMTSFNNTAQALTVKGTVQRRGLCGDVFLVGTPAAERLGDLRVATSVSRWAITFDAALAGLGAGPYTLRADVSDQGRPVKTFTSAPFAGADLKDGRFAFTADWRPDKLWDLHTPQNQYEVSLSLLDAAGKPLDTALPQRFGFREFTIDGRDFRLNGTKLQLSVTPLDNGMISAATATYDAACESFRRLKSVGINFVYGHNYGCEPGTHLSFEEILRAADDVGLLVALSQPHFGQYDWQAKDADATNGYARHAEAYVRVAGSHPSVVAYSMSHNSVGYAESMNPDMIDGVQDPRVSWGKTAAQRALHAEAIVHRLDPDRIVYHHSSGNLGSMHTNNFYANFVPSQEMDDWFEHWATKGVKPLFLCEYGAPLSWDFTMYRGWYRGARNYGSATIPWELCLAEWNSQFFGDDAFKLSEVEQQCLRWEGKQFATGQGWHRWDYPYELGSTAFAEQYPAMARYITDNWRAFRTWGVSATNAWELSSLWRLRDGVKKERRELTVDWDHLQRPGFSPDYIDAQYVRRDLAYQPEDWIATPAGEALVRNNRPLLAWLAGKPAAFTEKGHNVQPGETVEKQLIVLNNGRVPVTAECRWSLALPAAVTGAKQISVPAGEQERLPLRFELPADLPPGTYALTAEVAFSTGERQQDTFTLNVLPKLAGVEAPARIALFDPRGETTKLLAGLGVKAEPVEAAAALTGYDLLILGKGALTAAGPGPDLSRVRDGLKVIAFEQTTAALEQRLGFRVTEYGLRMVYPRVPGHPALAGLTADTLHDWRGEATLLPPRLSYELSKTYGATAPTVRWAGLEVPRIWRAGCRGNVASVLIEKPARGDFLPLVDGGYSLQYSPLMEYREGRGMVLFCQLDVTGRTEADPAADTVVRNLLRYANAWQPSPRRRAVYAGDPAGRRHLDAAGLAPEAFGGKLSPDQVLIVGAGGGKAPAAPAVAQFVRSGGHLVAVGLDADEANAFLPAKVEMKRAEHIAATFAPFGTGSPFTGVGPADVHNRAPRELPLVTGGAEPVGDGVLAQANGQVVFDQLPPWTISRAEGAAAGWAVVSGDAPDGGHYADVSLGFATAEGVQFGQPVKTPPEVGKSYTFAVMLLSVGRPVSLHLEVERAGRPWDRAVKAPPVEVPAGRWTDLHVTFACDKPFPEGWQAYVAGGGDGDRFQADQFRLYEGDYVPPKAGEPGPTNRFTNASFETGTEPFFFRAGEQYNLRRTWRRAAYRLNRELANLGVAGTTPLLARFAAPVAADKPEQRWLDGLYLDQPIAWDDPYRFFCW